MPNPGLSLVGFMDPAQALPHLKFACVPNPPNITDAALLANWQTAQQQLGAPIPNAGTPNMTQIPATDPHVANLLQQPWVRLAFQNPAYNIGNATFQMIEIDPLLAYQFTVDSNRSTQKRQGFSPVPTRQQLLDLCLPLAPPVEPYNPYFVLGQQSVMVKADSLNMRNLYCGFFKNPNPLVFNPDFTDAVMGILVGTGLPFMHVVRFNGRCYLHNGFHRALAIRASGQTHMPCIFRDVQDQATAGIRTDGGTFALQRLEAPNPPTVGHFTQGRAYQVDLRQLQRILHVSWAEWTIPAE